VSDPPPDELSTAANGHGSRVFRVKRLYQAGLVFSTGGSFEMKLTNGFGVSGAEARRFTRTFAPPQFENAH
jgi:hypothetical protein